MKPEPRDLLKPPFTARTTLLGALIIYDAEDKGILEGYPLPANFRVEKLTKEHIKAFSQFLVDSLNEKYQRDFAEHKRWTCENMTLTCPDCDAEFWQGAEGEIIESFNYCPNCGVRLLEPLEDKDDRN